MATSIGSWFYKGVVFGLGGIFVAKQHKNDDKAIVNFG